MSNALFAKNKIGFVDGTITMPKPGSSDLMNWRHCNAMVRGWLTSAMEKEIRNSVKYAATTHDIWNDLQERFGKGNDPRAYELRRAITMIRQEGISISTYYTKLCGVWDEIQSMTPTPKCTCGGCTCDLSKEIINLCEKEHLYDFLMGLNDEYVSVKTQILSSRPPLSIGAAYHLVSQDEQQRLIGAAWRVAPETATFQASRTSSKPTFQTSSKQEERGGGDRRCTKCHKPGHTIDGCFKLIGYPEWWLEKYGSRKSQPRAAAVAAGSSPIPRLTGDQFTRLMKMIEVGNGGN